MNDNVELSVTTLSMASTKTQSLQAHMNSCVSAMPSTDNDTDSPSQPKFGPVHLGKYDLADAYTDSL
jgi:hypothetical protein